MDAKGNHANGTTGDVSPEEAEQDGMFAVEQVDEGDQFMAVKPWLGAIKAPENFTKLPPGQDIEPKVSLQLEHVHGYRAR